MILSREFNFTLALSLHRCGKKLDPYIRESSSHLEREARNSLSDERNYSVTVMNQRRRMPDDDAGYYRALK